MRLISAIVRAYRLHRETTVSFDPHRTLIGGPNEAGKSTLAEASWPSVSGKNSIY